MSWIDSQTCLTDERTLEQDQEAFLDAVRACYTVFGACAQVGMNRGRVYTWLSSDSTFSERLQRAQAESLDMAEAELRRRGVFGWERPVYQSGRQVLNADGSPAVVVERDTTALIAWLKARNRDVFGDRLDVSHHGMVAKAYAGVDLARILHPDGSSPAGELPALPEPAIATEAQPAVDTLKPGFAES